MSAQGSTYTKEVKQQPQISEEPYQQEETVVRVRSGRVYEEEEGALAIRESDTNPLDNLDNDGNNNSEVQTRTSPIEQEGEVIHDEV